jgi:hypothetical protein
MKYLTKKNLVFSFLIILILVVIYVIYSIIFSFKYSSVKYSENISNSKENGFFLTTYKPINKFIQLNANKIKTEKIWAEKNWNQKPYIFSSKIEIEDGMKIVLPFPNTLYTDLSFNVYVKDFFPNSPNGCFVNMLREKQSFRSIINTKQDTLILLFTYDANVKVCDTIKYIKEKN